MADNGAGVPFSGSVPMAWGRSFQETLKQMEGPPAEPWVDALALNILLTVQSVQRLHTAFGQKFIGR